MEKNASDNSVVESGGPYTNSSNTQSYDPQPQDDQTISLTADGCYYFEVNDSQNNGVFNFPNHEDGPSFFRLLNGNGNTIVEIFGDDYKTSIKRKFLYKQVSSIKETAIETTSIFPNPTNGLSTLKFDAKQKANNVDLNVINIMGEVVLANSINLNVGANSNPLQLGHLVAGIYTVELTSTSVNISHKLVKLD